MRTYGHHLPLRRRIGPGLLKIAMEVLEQFGTAYDIHTWWRYITWLGLLSYVGFLIRVMGFPPEVWRLLVKELLQLLHSPASREAVTLLSLAALLLSSLLWLVLWGLLFWTVLALVIHRWRSRRKKRAVATSWMPSRHSADESAVGAINRPLHLALKQHYDLAEVPTDHKYVQDGMVTRTLKQHYDLADVPTVPERHRKIAQQAPPPKQLRPKGTPGMEVGAGWDPGITRQDRPNEDGLLALKGLCTADDRLLTFELFAVADGMGGHARGRDASQLAIQSMVQSVLLNIMGSEPVHVEYVIKTLIDSVQCANQEVYSCNQENGTDMGTTITAALVLDRTAYIVNVGDSRTYLYREGEGLAQVTRDHSLVARLVEAGTISPDEVYTHPQRNKVYRGLGDKETVKVDWFTVGLLAGDSLVLCSDGLWEMVRDWEIERIVKKYGTNPTQASHALVQAALRGGGKDNIGVIVAHLADDLQ